MIRKKAACFKEGKQLFVDNGSKRLEPGGICRDLYGKFSVFKWSYFSLFRQYLFKIVNTCLF